VPACLLWVSMAQLSSKLLPALHCSQNCVL